MSDVGSIFLDGWKGNASAGERILQNEHDTNRERRGESEDDANTHTHKIHEGGMGMGIGANKKQEKKGKGEIAGVFCTISTTKMGRGKAKGALRSTKNNAVLLLFPV